MNSNKKSDCLYLLTMDLKKTHIVHIFLKVPFRFSCYHDLIKQILCSKLQVHRRRNLKWHHQWFLKDMKSNTC